MATTRWAGARQQIGTLFGSGGAAGLSDDQLLERFDARRAEAAEAGAAAEAAFGAMVHRHGPMVLGVCRRLLDDPRDSEDAFQATFLVLARRSRSVRAGGDLGRWLGGVARRVALRARSEAARRRAREGAGVAEPATDPAAESRRADAREALDAELRRLPAKYRSAIESCLIEGLTISEAAWRSGCPEGTLAARLSRGRALLRSGLIRRGVAPGFLAALGSVAAVPEALAGATIRSATAGEVPARVSALVEGVLRTMLIAKIKLAAGLVTALATAAATAGFARPGAEEGRPPGPDEAPVAQAEPADDTTPYPIEIRPDKVHELPKLAIQVRDFRLESGPVSVIPIACKRGVTGVAILGRGTFRYRPEGGPAFEGEFRAAMLRFHPDELPTIVPLDEATRVTDRGAFELGRNLIDAVFGHCWHSGKQALIPTRGSIAAVVYSKEHGDLLVSDDGKTSVIHNFSTRKTLHQKK